MENAVVGIVGAGPLGLELAIALKQSGISYLHFEKGQIVQMIANFPPQTHFFSSSERIGIGDIPIQTINQQKCTREEYLAYIRSVVMHYGLVVNSYEEVQNVQLLPEKGFLLHTLSGKGHQEYFVRFLVLATGGTAKPKMLGIPGEELPHVSSKMKDPHHYFQREVVIVGGKNSAAESALRCFAAGARVHLVHRRAEFSPEHVKYWLLPDLLKRIEVGDIRCHFSSELVAIQSDSVVVKKAGREQFEIIPADFVIKAIGFDADMRLFKELGATLSEEQQAVLHDEWMQTTVPNLFVCGTAVAGTQTRYRIFIENTHLHIEKIMNALFARLSIKNGYKQKLQDQKIPQHPEE